MKKTCKILLIASLLPLTLLTACGENEVTSSSTDQATQIRPAKIIELVSKKADSLLSYPAVIGSQNLITLAFEIGGLLDELPVVEAQVVKKGEVLAKLDQQDLNTKLKSAQAQYYNANKEYKRAKRLIKADAISRSELDKRKSKNDVDKAAYLSAKKALTDSVLLAPFDGNIAKISVNLRQVLQPGEPALSILGSGGLEAKFNLPSNIIAKANAENKGKIQATITLDSAPDIEIPATFKELALQADPSSQTHEVTFAFEAPPNINVLPGMNALVWLSDPRKTSKNNQLNVPLTAIGIEGELTTFVWVVDKQTMKVSKRTIILGDDIGEAIQVLDGLMAGEKIIAAGISYLSEGMTVRPWLTKP